MIYLLKSCIQFSYNYYLVKICIKNDISCYNATESIFRIDTEKGRQGKVTLPVYLNATRGQLLFTLDFETEGEGSGTDHSFYERGVAIISSDLG